MSKQTFHIRKPLAKRCGNQFYKDQSTRKAPACCDKPMTDCDAAFNDRKVAVWRKADGTVMEPCPDCLMIRDEIKRLATFMRTK